ncbi:MAG: DUF2169 domain-containing protein [Deltaproteobacteria bacterium]|nr:DUF2169 domain-containing protein [Deltaproteobacteria bacterium]
MEIRNHTPFEVEALPLEWPDGGVNLTVVVKGTFEIGSGGVVTPAGEQIPVAFGDETYEEEGYDSVKFESDMVPFKPRADIALVGRAHAPDGRMVESLDVSMNVGSVKRRIRVIGDRYWRCAGRLLRARPTRPRPFAVMDLVYERAFGGIDMTGGGFCAENLVGRGFCAKKSKKTLDGAPLPNLEDPDHLIRKWKDHPKPVGFGFCGKAWAPRSGYLGTYDERWREERAPRPPEDFRMDFYNAAHPELQVSGYLKGNERVDLLNMSSEGRLRFQLPGIRVSGAAVKSFEQPAGQPPPGQETAGSGEPKETPVFREEIPFNLDTLCLIPEDKRLYMVWRGRCPVQDVIASEVREVEVRSL